MKKQEISKKEWNVAHVQHNLSQDNNWNCDIEESSESSATYL